MKKIVSIALLVILLFNWTGYRLLSSYLEDVSNAALEARLDRDQYNEDELISIRIPVTHLPYCTLGSGFERIDGQVEIGGVLYHYVKTRLLNDSLELVCIPNYRAMDLTSTRDEFFKLVNGLQQNIQGKKAGGHPRASKVFTPDDYTVQERFQLRDPQYVLLQRSFYTDTEVTSPFCQVIDYPPEL